MAFPSIISSQTSYQSDTTSHSITMPSSITTGNLLLVFFTCSTDSVSVSINTGASGNDWHELSEFSSSANTASCYYKIASSTNVLVLTTNSSEESSSIVYNISGNTITSPIIDYADGGIANANPPSITPTKGTQDYLFIVFAGITGDIIASAAPSNFTGLTTIQSTATGSSCSSAHRQYNTGSAYDPSTFTTTAAYWVTFTVCIAPNGADGISIGSLFIRN